MLLGFKYRLMWKQVELFKNEDNRFDNCKDHRN